MKKTLSILIVAIYMFSVLPFTVSRISAEGESAELSMVLSRSVLNLGKTFSVTVYIKPNINVNITTFDMVMTYDNSKVTPVEENGIIKIEKTTKVPGSFKLSSVLDGNEIVVLGEDDSALLNAPIAASGNTPIMVVYFIVKDNALVGSQASFLIKTEMTAFTIITGGDPVPIALEEAAPKSAVIGAKLDTNTYLSSVKPGIGTLVPAFSKTVTSYSLEVADDRNSIDFSATAESAKSTVKITGGGSLNFGPNTITIKVTAEDPDFSRTYTITVNRASPPTPTHEDPSPTEELSMESAEISSETSSEVSEDPTPTPPVTSTDEPQEKDPWKTATIILALVCAALAGTTLWLAIDKVTNRDKIVKVKHV